MQPSKSQAATHAEDRDEQPLFDVAPLGAAGARRSQGGCASFHLRALRIISLQGGSTTGALVRHFAWHGSVRIWWHGERALTAAEAARASKVLSSASSAEERLALLHELYAGVVVTQASAMEDPYRDQAPPDRWPYRSTRASRLGLR